MEGGPRPRAGVGLVAEPFLGVEQLPLGPDIGAVRLLNPALGGVPELILEHLLQAGAQVRVTDGGGHLHPAGGVAGHKVGGGDIDPAALPLAEEVDAGVLQVAPHDAHHPDMFRQAGHAPNEAADAPHHQVDFHPGVGRLNELVDELFIGEPVELEAQVGGTSRFGLLNFPVDEGGDFGFQAGRGHQQQPAVLHHLAHGQGIEHPRGLRAELGVGGHEGEVGVQPHGVLVIVSRAHLGDILHLALVHPGDEQQLGVDLQPVQAVDHPAPGLLQHPGPADVVFLVEPGPQLHQGHYLFAVFGGIHQGLHDFAVVGHPVKGHFDGHHVRILARLLEEAQQRPHVLIGIGEHQVAAADLLRHGDQGVHVGGVLGHPAGIEQLCLIPEHIPQRTHKGEIQGGAAGKQVLFGQPQAGAQAVPHGVGELALVVQPHGLEALAAADHLLHALAVFLRQHPAHLRRGVVHVDVGAAHQPDKHGALHLIMGENLGEESGDQLLHQHKPPALAGEGDQAAQDALAAGDDAHALAAALGLQDGHGVNLLVAQEGEGLLAPDDLGGEQGQHVGGKVFFQKGLGLIL